MVAIHDYAYRPAPVRARLCFGKCRKDVKLYRIKSNNLIELDKISLAIGRYVDSFY